MTGRRLEQTRRLLPVIGQVGGRARRSCPVVGRTRFLDGLGGPRLGGLGRSRTRGISRCCRHSCCVGVHRRGIGRRASSDVGRRWPGRSRLGCAGRGYWDAGGCCRVSLYRGGWLSIDRPAVNHPGVSRGHIHRGSTNRSGVIRRVSIITVTAIVSRAADANPNPKAAQRYADANSPAPAPSAAPTPTAPPTVTAAPASAVATATAVCSHIGRGSKHECRCHRHHDQESLHSRLRFQNLEIAYQPGGGFQDPYRYILLPPPWA